MTTYLERFNLGNSEEFKQRCQMALLDAAVDVMSEDPSTYGHEARAVMAGGIIADPVHSAIAMATVVAASGLLSDSSTDAEMADLIDANWNTYAGVVPA